MTAPTADSELLARFAEQLDALEAKGFDREPFLRALRQVPEDLIARASRAADRAAAAQPGAMAQVSDRSANQELLSRAFRGDVEALLQLFEEQFPQEH